MQYLILFLEGIITFISPCLLPMLPIYMTYFAGQQLNNNPKRTLLNAVGFVAGFTLLFVVLGAFAGTVGRFFREHMTVLNIVTGSIVIVFGLNFLGVLKIGFLNRTKAHRMDVGRLGFFSSMLFGIVFAVSWTPCVSAFLGTALMMAAGSGSSTVGIMMLLCYSLGLGIPFVLSAVLIGKLKSAFDFIKRNYKVIHTVSGVLLILLGILMMTGMMGYVLSLMTF